MKTLTNLTIAILTYNRPRELCYCLLSVAKQTYYPQQVLLIDSGTHELTKKIVRYFQLKYQLPIIIHSAAFSHMGVLRNQAIHLSATTWLAFIDDDCILSPTWSHRIQMSLESSGLAAVQGRDYPYQRTVYGMLCFLYTFYWKYQMSNRWQEISSTLDTKNVLLNIKWLRKKAIIFDESGDNEGRGEDCDLGLQIQRSDGKIKYDRLLLVTHREPSSFRQFIKKSRNAITATQSVEKKWLITKKFSSPFYHFLLRFLMRVSYFNLLQKTHIVLLHIYLVLVKKIIWKAK